MRHIDIAEYALKKLKSLNIDAAEISVAQSSGFSVAARLGDVETVEHHLEKGISITVFHKHCTGSASCSDFSFDSIDATLQKAITIAQFSSADSYAGLADVNRLAKIIPDCDLVHPWNISTHDAITLAIACEKKAMSMDKRIVNSEGAQVSTMQSHFLYANSAGFLGESNTSEHGISCSVVASDNHKMQRNDEYTVARNPADLRPIDFIAKQAAEKAVKSLNARKIKTQSCPLIFEASIAKSLLSSFVAAISGGNLYRQSSFLLNALGKPIFPAFIDVYQQPHLLSQMGSSSFDREGVATVDQHYVRGGELVSYALGSYSARKLGMQTTGNAGGVFNLSIYDTNTQLSCNWLIKKMHRGLLITELMGQGVNITTGDYSRGAAGFWVEDGKIQFPVEEITIAGNLKSMLMGIIAIADDVDTRGSIRTGSILIDQMTVAGD